MSTEPYVSRLRLRMSSKDAHYAGGLCAGAKMLELFGDVATELLIQHDGDEGLFAGYANVEFKAPVYAGDYIEARGWISRVGNSSREMQFEAYKVIVPAQGDGLAASAADLLDEPVLVCKATGTCVTPKALQRKSR